MAQVLRRQPNYGVQGAECDEGASSSEGGEGCRAYGGSSGGNKSRYRGVSFDKKKRKWRVQIKARPSRSAWCSVCRARQRRAAPRHHLHPPRI